MLALQTLAVLNSFDSIEFRMGGSNFWPKDYNKISIKV
jgi:hypothetical protein